jgi:hypothetical protein
VRVMQPQVNGTQRGCPESVELDNVLISERGIYAASPFKAISMLKRVETRAPSAKYDTKSRSRGWLRDFVRCPPVKIDEIRQSVACGG